MNMPNGGLETMTAGAAGAIVKRRQTFEWRRRT